MSDYLKRYYETEKKLKSFEFKGDNPVFDFWKSIYGNLLTNNNRLFKFCENTFMQGMLARNEVVHRFAWAVPSDEAIKKIVEFSPIIEMGAGTGYWANLIQKAGGEIVAFDSHPIGSGTNSWHENKHLKYPMAEKSFFNVQKGGAEKVKDFPNHTLFLC